MSNERAPKRLKIEEHDQEDMMPPQKKTYPTAAQLRMLVVEVELEARPHRSHMTELGKSSLIGHLIFSIKDRSTFLGLRQSHEERTTWVWQVMTKLGPLQQILFYVDPPITIAFKGRCFGGEVIFKLRRRAKFRRAMNEWHRMKGVSAGNVRFFFDGSRVQPTDSPVHHEMVDGDTVEVLHEQGGGCGIDCPVCSVPERVVAGSVDGVLIYGILNHPTGI